MTSVSMIHLPDFILQYVKKSVEADEKLAVFKTPEDLAYVAVEFVECLLVQMQ